MNEEDEPVERLLFFSVGLAAAWIFGVTAVRLGNEVLWLAYLWRATS
jgi:hypothetical protein